MNSRQLVNFCIKFAHYTSFLVIALPAAIYGVLPLGQIYFAYFIAESDGVPFSRGEQAGILEKMGYLNQNTLAYLEQIQAEEPWIVFLVGFSSVLISFLIVSWWYVLVRVLKSISYENFFLEQNTFFLKLMGVSAVCIPATEFLVRIFLRIYGLVQYDIAFHKGLIWLGITCLVLAYMNKQGVAQREEVELTV